MKGPDYRHQRTPFVRKRVETNIRDGNPLATKAKEGAVVVEDAGE